MTPSKYDFKKLLSNSAPQRTQPLTPSFAPGDYRSAHESTPCPPVDLGHVPGLDSPSTGSSIENPEPAMPSSIDRIISGLPMPNITDPWYFIARRAINSSDRQKLVDKGCSEDLISRSFVYLMKLPQGTKRSVVLLPNLKNSTPKEMLDYIYDNISSWSSVGFSPSELNSGDPEILVETYRKLHNALCVKECGKPFHPSESFLDMELQNMGGPDTAANDLSEEAFLKQLLEDQIPLMFPEISAPLPKKDMVEPIAVVAIPSFDGTVELAAESTQPLGTEAAMPAIESSGLAPPLTDEVANFVIERIEILPSQSADLARQCTDDVGLADSQEDSTLSKKRTRSVSQERIPRSTKRTRETCETREDGLHGSQTLGVPPMQSPLPTRRSPRLNALPLEQ